MGGKDKYQARFIHKNGYVIESKKLLNVETREDLENYKERFDDKDNLKTN